jgi:hypothetical protein
MYRNCSLRYKQHTFSIAFEAKDWARAAGLTFAEN